MQGTYECFAEIARRQLRRLARGDDHADRRARRDGRRAAAGGDDERRRRAVRRGRRASASSGGCRRATSTRGADSLDDAVARCRAAKRRAARAVGRAARPTPPTCCPQLLSTGFEADIVTDQTSAHDPLGGYMPDRHDAGGGRRAARATTRHEYVAPLARRDGRPLRGDGRVPGRRRRGVRLRQQPARGGASSAASSARSTTRASCPPTSGRCSARARGRSAGSRCRATRPTSPRPTARCSRSSPTTSGWRAGSSEAGEKIAFQGLPARICWLGYGERHRLGLRFNEMVAQRRAEGRRS